ncbi:MAG: hypothetical protein HGB12_16745, partial [Bacteroidetes bacterium]|nr:hypothetical protein [Bacteroidota bacterium]
MKFYRLNGYDIEECPEKEAPYWRCKNLFRNYIEGWRVSTIFLCRDHNFNNIEEIKELPLLFETMIFDPKGNIARQRGQ